MKENESSDFFFSSPSIQFKYCIYREEKDPTFISSKKFEDVRAYN